MKIRGFYRLALAACLFGVGSGAWGQLSAWDLATESVMHAQTLDQGFIHFFANWVEGDKLDYEYSLDWGSGSFRYATLANQVLGGEAFSLSAVGIYSEPDTTWTWNTTLTQGAVTLKGTSVLHWLPTDEDKDMEISGDWVDGDGNVLGTASGKAKVHDPGVGGGAITSSGTFDVKDKKGVSKGSKSLSDIKERDPGTNEYKWKMYAAVANTSISWNDSGTESGNGLTGASGTFGQSVVPEPVWTPGLLALLVWSKVRRRR